MDSCQSGADSMSRTSKVARAETSPSLGHSRTPTTPPNSYLCKDGTQASHRPHLSSVNSESPSRFPQQGSSTFPLSSGVSYLGLPLSDPDPESPPYQPGTDDVASLDMHKAGKRKKRQRRLNKSITSHIDYIKKAQNEQSFEPRQNKSDCESRMSNSDSSIFPSTPVDIEHLGNNAGITYFGLDEGLPETEQFTKVLLSKKQANQSLIGTSAVPLPSLTTAFAVGASGRKASQGSSSAIISETTSGETKPRRRSRAYREGSRRKKSIQAQKHDTPAIITLRKASSIRQIRKRRSTNRGSWKISNSKQQPITDKGPQEAPPELIMNPENFTTDAPACAVKSITATHRLKSNSPPLPSSPLGIKRSSTTVDLALITAEVYPTPNSYSPTKNYRKHSVLAIDTMRRMSMVQTQTLSKSESLEVIWDRNDSPISFSSTSWLGFGSSSHVSEPDTSSEGGSTDSPPLRSRHGSKALYFNSSSLPLPAIVAVDTIVSPPFHVPQDLLKWSWDRQTTTEQLSGIRNTNADTEDMALDKAVKRPSNGRCDKNLATTSVFDGGTVESFPPLLKRKSTSDWQKSPPVGLTNPLVGRQSLGQPKIPESRASSLIKADLLLGSLSHVQDLMNDSSFKLEPRSRSVENPRYRPRLSVSRSLDQISELASTFGGLSQTPVA